ncbi:MAG: EF-P beta-lysylation protein EpmB [Gammaproteobacteria bacterium]|nr:EF-P beta-lysylation protein EpmB [Gammaproteobacteria bacterium]
MKSDMITRIAGTWQTEDWQKSLAESIRDPVILLEQLQLPGSLLPAASKAASLFPLRVPWSYLRRIEKGNPADPLLLQVLPLHRELDTPPEGFSDDPVADLDASPVPGLIHKYTGRVLLITTGACAIHCRYCFRRHFPYGDSSSTPPNLPQILDYIRADDRIEEVILSGGDPFSLSNHRLQLLGQQLADIPHLKRLRIHSRLPIVLPERIDTGLLNWLSSLPLQTILVTHCNHAREIDEPVRHALSRLSQLGVTLLNQSVLLKGVNDTPETLSDLSRGLFSAGILPYYLHQLDKVKAAHHFEVSDQDAIGLIQTISHSLPGYLVPKLVRDIPGNASKQLIQANLL